MKPLETRFTSLCQDWKVAEYALLGGTGKIPAPSRDKVLQWLWIPWNDISATIIQNYFTTYGFTIDLNINIDLALDFI